jgi:ribonuclease PH
MRHDGRLANQLRPIKVQRYFTTAAPGSVLISAGKTTLLCTASIDTAVPPWKAHLPPDQLTGWLTAEYCMLPGSTAPRKRREREKVDGRSTEIQRLIGRSLRAALNFKALGPRTITIDCDVLEADGGTRTLAITGGFIALADALATIAGDVDLSRVVKHSIAAVSVGVSNEVPVLDLDYVEDSAAEVDMNVVMTGGGLFIEVQGTAEGTPFSQDFLDSQLALAKEGIAQLTRIQRDSLGENWPMDKNSSN